MQKKVIHIYRITIAFVLITVMGVVGLLLRILSLGYLTNFNRSYLIPIMSKCILYCIGINIDNQLPLLNLKEPHLITFNHNSFLDGFILMTLRFTNTYFLLSEKMLVYVPLTLASWAMNVQFVPMQEDKERRLNFFMRLTAKVKRNGFHVVGSSEGVSDNFNRIAPFNRGVYHMAMANQMSVVAVFIYTPTISNPSGDFRPIKNGTVRLELIDVIPTKDWKFEDLDIHIDAVRKLYVHKFNASMEVQTT